MPTASPLLLLLASALACSSAELELTMRRRAANEAEESAETVIHERVTWDPESTALVICDMWDAHWCRGASARVAEMAPRINRVAVALRERGVLIVHCPSDTMGYYEGTPARLRAQSAPPAETVVPLKSWCGLDPAREPPLPIDDRDGGCDCDPTCQTGKAWTRQIETIEIRDDDAVTDSAEAHHLMAREGITNVLVLGVHLNMCVLGRPFAIRQMVGQGRNVVLVRDLTDTMYNSRSRPYVSHFTGTDRMVEHVERYWCPSVTSDQLMGGTPFRFGGQPVPGPATDRPAPPR